MLFLSGLLAFQSCRDENENKSAPTFAFKDQMMSGKIDDVTWTKQDGIAEANTVGQASVLNFAFFITQPGGSACQVAFPIKGAHVSFLVVGVKGLYAITDPDPYKSNGAPSVTITTADGSTLIAKRGAVEILGISNTTVSGRIDAYADDQNFVNGNFEVLICR